ncbi:hypothetical protein [Kitasatospora brasiliensis]|uniref:hypothetical protein n=1 Tax=Kitasatospora brasiliensis TaxID=3058040 RepID=UPI002931608F|nr:hypothetical protein [Kitasatospora sp. K002]
MLLTTTTLTTTFQDLATRLDGYIPNPRPGDDPDVQRLTNHEGRSISARIRCDGVTLQLWVTAPGRRPKEPQPTRRGALPPGSSYHAVMHLHGLDGDPAELIHATLLRDLLPTFDNAPLYVGHRPWETTTTNRPDTPAPTESDPHSPTPADTTDPAAPTPTTPDTSEPDTPTPAQPSHTPKPNARAPRKRAATTPRTPADKPTRAHKTATKGAGTKPTAARKATTKATAEKKTTTRTSTPRTRKTSTASTSQN